VASGDSQRDRALGQGDPRGEEGEEVPCTGPGNGVVRHRPPLLREVGQPGAGYCGPGLRPEEAQLSDLARPVVYGSQAKAVPWLTVGEAALWMGWRMRPDESGFRGRKDAGAFVEMTWGPRRQRWQPAV
jgi:hypothetical protein